MKEIDKPKTCLYCGKTFYHKNKTVKYCGRNCASRQSMVNKGFKILKEQIRICVVCGKEFTPKTNDQKCCGQECQFKRCSGIQKERKQYHICKHCSKEFPHKGGEQKNIFCSRECAFEHKKAKPKEPKLVYKRNCILCNKEFETTKENKRCCSPECSQQIQNRKAKENGSYEVLKAKLREQYRKQNNIILDERPCLECGRLFIPERVKSFCSNKCMKKHIRRISKGKRRARKKLLPRTLTAAQWRETFNYFSGNCAYCGQPHEEIHQEHFLAESKGGGYTQNNIIPACRDCNLDKSDHDFFEWYPSKPFYSELRERKILNYLGVDEKCQNLKLQRKKPHPAELILADQENQLNYMY